MSQGSVLGETALSLYFMTPLLYSILFLTSEGLICSDGMSSPGNADPGNRILLMNPLGHVSWSGIPDLSSH